MFAVLHRLPLSFIPFTTVIVSIVLLLTPKNLQAAPQPPEVAGHTYILMDYASGIVLAERKPDLRVEPASITKVMTAYIVFQELAAKHLTLTDSITISERAWRSEGSRTFVQVGTAVPLEALLKGMIVQSGNDAAIALAERIGNSEAGFAQLMNDQAKRLGMTGTHFTNATGLPESNHYTTARDVALLSRALIRDFPEFYKWHSLREFVWGGITQQNRNGLLTRDASVDGIKTGHHDSAGYCLASSAQRKGMRLITTIFGATSVGEREDSSATLLNFGFNFYESSVLRKQGEIILKPRLYKGEREFIGVTPGRDIVALVARGEGANLRMTTTLTEPLVAPMVVGKRVGEAVVRNGKVVVARVPLIAAETVSEGNLAHNVMDTLALWLR